VVTDTEISFSGTGRPEKVTANEITDRTWKGCW